MELTPLSDLQVSDAELSRSAVVSLKEQTYFFMSPCERLVTDGCFRSVIVVKVVTSEAYLGAL